MIDKKFMLFTIEHDLKGMTRYCEHDERYEMRFERKDGEKVEFISSRAEVAAKYGDESKEASVGHFEDMAMDWYAEKYKNEDKQ